MKKTCVVKFYVKGYGADHIDCWYFIFHVLCIKPFQVLFQVCPHYRYSAKVDFCGIGLYFCLVSVAFCASNGCPAGKRAFKFLKTLSTQHIIVNSIQLLNKRKAVLLLCH